MFFLLGDGLLLVAHRSRGNERPFSTTEQVKRVGVVAIVRFSGSAAFSTQTPIIIIKIAVNHTSHVKFIDDFSK
jgi:hypothetical protein